MNQCVRSTGNFERLYLVAILAGMIGAGLFWFLFPPQYEAETWFFAYSKVSAHAYFRVGPDTEYEAFLATQFAIIKSPQLLEEVLNDPRLAQVKEHHEQKNPVEWLRQNISIAREGKSEFFVISYRDPVPEEAQTVVAAVAHAYLERYQIDATASESRFRVILDMEPKLPTEPCIQPRLNLTFLVGVGVFWLTLLGGCVMKHRRKLCLCHK